MERAELESSHLARAPIRVDLADDQVVLHPKVFKTGSLGWYGQGKVIIDDEVCQVGFTITVVGSKPGWVSSHPARDTRRPPILMPGEQNGTMPQNAQDAPPASSALFPEDQPSKKPRKRS
jgi:hypothetical protein